MLSISRAERRYVVIWFGSHSYVRFADTQTSLGADRTRPTRTASMTTRSTPPPRMRSEAAPAVAGSRDVSIVVSKVKDSSKCVADDLVASTSRVDWRLQSARRSKVKRFLFTPNPKGAKSSFGLRSAPPPHEESRSSSSLAAYAPSMAMVVVRRDPSRSDVKLAPPGGSRITENTSVGSVVIGYTLGTSSWTTPTTRMRRSRFTRLSSDRRAAERWKPLVNGAKGRGSPAAIA
mmetsp:Transcript_26654/g.82941  ORF Transcript_26654/g.82941 Transcript_26654/m.82941 type:complete len:233 (-) Transcript_26654:37-735(-)